MGQLRLCQCGLEPRLCYTGKVYKIVCDNDYCPKQPMYGKTKEMVIEKWNGKSEQAIQNCEK